MDPKQGGGVLHRLALSVDEIPRVLDLDLGERRPRPELHAARLGGGTAGPGAIDDEGALELRVMRSTA
jgi:hypothetical protein